MNDATPLLARIIVRHRAPGHLRLQVPAELCVGAIPAFLEQGLHQVEGVRRAVVYPALGKLALHYDESVCSATQVARKLAQLVGLLLDRGLVGVPAPAPRPSLTARVRARWQERVQDLKAKAALASLLVGREMRGHPVLRALGEDPERAVINFLNDAVTFYLIKVHWNLILKFWLRRPWSHRYEWLGAFYLVFLLVRSRRQAAPK